MTHCSGVLGNDFLYSGDEGNGDYTGILDRLYGEAGNDSLQTLDGNDYLNGGADSGFSTQERESMLSMGGRVTIICMGKTVTII